MKFEYSNSLKLFKFQTRFFLNEPTHVFPSTKPRRFSSTNPNKSDGISLTLNIPTQIFFLSEEEKRNPTTKKHNLFPDYTYSHNGTWKRRKKKKKKSIFYFLRTSYRNLSSAVPIAILIILAILTILTVTSLSSPSTPITTPSTPNPHVDVFDGREEGDHWSSISSDLSTPIQSPNPRLR